VYINDADILYNRGIKSSRKKHKSEFLLRPTPSDNPLSLVSNYSEETCRVASQQLDKDALYYFELNFDLHYPSFRVSLDIISTAKREHRSRRRAPFPREET